MNITNKTHTPVLLNEVLQYLEPKINDSYLDLTAGAGGHAEAILELTDSQNSAVLVDRDEDSSKVLLEKFPESTVINMDYLSASRQLSSEGKHFDIILADLGVSSMQMDQGERGFSIKNSGPVDMRMDSSQKLDASQIVNNWDELKIADIIQEYGEEPKAKKVARIIVENRPINTTDELASLLQGIWPKGKSHSATRTFQALRIAVNDELNQLSLSLPIWTSLLKPGGKIGIISFHSLEDRIVKKYFSEFAAGEYDSPLSLLSKKPIIPSPHEIDFNPRARSAKLRVACKNKNILV